MGSFIKRDVNEVVDKIAIDNIPAIEKRRGLYTKTGKTQNIVEVYVQDLQTALKAAYEQGRKDGNNG